jgi:hypothetical protein
MEIHFGPKIGLAERIRRSSRPQRGFTSPVTLTDFIQSPLICLSAPHIPQVQAVEAIGKKGEVTLIRLDEVHRLLGEGLAAYAYNAEKDQDYLVLKAAFNQHAKAIYGYERRPALANIEKKCSAAEGEKELFESVEREVVKRKGSLNNLRQLAFILREASETETGFDYLTATTVLLHNFDLKEAESIMSSPKKMKSPLRKNIAQIMGILQRFKEINGVPYRPPAKKSRDYTQTYMEALIKISKGNGRALLLLFAHKLSSIKMTSDDAQLITGQSMWELFAPLAERFGLWEMASKMRNEAFRLEDPEKYQQCEDKIVKALSMSRREAEEFLSRVKELLSAQLAEDKVDCSLIRTRVKTPWGAEKKSENKPEEYPEIFEMSDLLAGTAVTKKALKLGEVLALTEKALGDEFKSFIYTDNQTETKTILVGEKKIQVHHVMVLLQNGNSLELQFMSEEAYQVLERGRLAHWVYNLKKLKELAEQKFDEALLELCAQRMNGNLLHDVEIVYQTLEPWLYVFMEDEKRAINVYRRMWKSIPLDVAAFVLNNDLSNYGGTKACKIWEDRRKLRETGELDPLEDGDLLTFKKGNFMEQSSLNLRSLLNAARHPETKLLLFPETLIKPLRRK